MNLLLPKLNITFLGLQTGYVNRVPLVLTNPGASTPTGYQMLVTVNSLAYNAYENGKLDNVQFTYLNGTIIPSWLQSGNSNTSKQTQYYLKMGTQLPGGNSGKLTVYMDFAKKSIILLNNATTGEAPNLSASYGEYDNGRNVFNFYDNFAGNTLDSQWTSSNSTGGNDTVAIDNGITFTRDVISCGTGCESARGFAMILLNSGIPVNSSQYLEAYIAQLSGGVSTPNCGTYGCGTSYSTSTPFALGEVENDNPLSNGLVYGSLSGEGGYGPAPFSEGIEKASFANGFYNLQSNPNPGGSIWGMEWITNTSSQFSSPYPNYTSRNINTIIEDPPGTLYPALGIINYQISGLNGYTNIATADWIRTRDDPASINITFGPIQSPTNSSIKDNLEIYGQPDTLRATAQAPNDTLKMLFDGNTILIINGSLNYTFCSGGSICPTAGMHNVTVEDTTANQVVYQPLIVFNSPAVSVIPNSISLDSGQSVELSADVAGGTGAFSYQWYNTTSGNSIAIPNATTQFLTINSNTVGNFTYKVVLTDSGSVSTVNITANASVRIYSALNVSVYGNSQVTSGRQIILRTNMSGGSGSFSYQWLNISGIGQIGFPINGQMSPVLNITANQTGAFNYSILVTDKVTGEQFLASPVKVKVLPSPHSYIKYYVPITITNSQNAPTSSPSQQMITVNSLNYAKLESHDLQNIQFLYPNYTIIPSWLESGDSNTSASTVYWLRLDTPISASGNQTVWMGFAPTNMSLMPIFTGLTGEAPELSPLYGEYDNGKQVFPLYDNFAGNTLNTTLWDNYGYDAVVSNGIMLNPSSNGEHFTTQNSINESEYTVSFYGKFTVAHYPNWIWGYGFDFSCGPCVSGIGLNYINGAIEWGSSGAPYSGADPQGTTGVFTVYRNSTVQLFSINYTNEGSSGLYGSSSGSYPVGVGSQTNDAAFNITWFRLSSNPPNGIMPSVIFGRTVAVAPPINSITVAPQSPMLDNGQSITLSSNVIGGTPPYAYQWYSGIFGLSNAIIPDATNSMVTVTPNATTRYFVIVTDSKSMSANSISDTVAVANTPSATLSAPSNAVLDYGQAETYTITANNGIGPFTANLVQNSVVLQSIAILLPGGSNTFSFTPQTGMDTFNAIVTDKGTTIPYTFATASNSVTVNPALSIPAVTPSASALDRGQSITIRAVESSGTPPYSYDFTISNAVSNAALASSGAQAGNTFTFTINTVGTFHANVSVKDSASTPVTVTSLYSNSFTVNPPLAATVTPYNLTLLTCQNVTLTANVFGGTPLYAYQWYNSSTGVGVIISNAIDSNYTFTAHAAPATGQYTNISYYANVTDSATATVKASTNFAVIHRHIPAGC